MADAAEKDEIIEKLEAELSNVEWSALQNHLERGAIIVVDRSLDLVQTAAKVARDDVEDVEEYLQKRLLAKPTQNQLDLWGMDMRKQFLFVIVQPYVLIQEIVN